MERPFIKKLDLYTFVKRLLKRFKDSCSINRKEGLGRPRSVITEENTHLVEELTFSQEEADDVCRNRRYAYAIALAKNFERNTRMIEKALWQDE